MMISTRGRYALRVMTDLARHDDGGFTPLKDVSQRENISQKYLEAIMTVLSKGGLVDAQHGKSGGYRLNRRPEDYPLGEILRLTEGTLAPVSCVDVPAECEEAPVCPTLPVWGRLNELINDYLDGVSLADLMPETAEGGAASAPSPDENAAH